MAVTNPIYKHAPEEFFPAPPALEVARAIRRDDVAALDRLFAQEANYRGTWGAAGLAAGIYYYLLTFGDDTPPVKGWVEVVR